MCLYPRNIIPLFLRCLCIMKLNGGLPVYLRMLIRFIAERPVNPHPGVDSSAMGTILKGGGTLVKLQGPHKKARETKGKLNGNQGKPGQTRESLRGGGL